MTWVVVGWLALLVAKVFLGALIRFISDAYLKLSAIKQERWRQARPTLQPVSLGGPGVGCCLHCGGVVAVNARDAGTGCR